MALVTRAKLELMPINPERSGEIDSSQPKAFDADLVIIAPYAFGAIATRESNTQPVGILWEDLLLGDYLLHLLRRRRRGWWRSDFGRRRRRHVFHKDETGITPFTEIAQEIFTGNAPVELFVRGKGDHPFEGFYFMRWIHLCTVFRFCNF